MKKRCLALSALIAVIFGRVSAFGMTLNEDEKAKLDFYGKMNFIYDYAGEGQFSGNYSRIGVDTSSKVSQQLSVFAKAEFRYDASERNTEQVFNDLRNTYVGFDTTFGKVTLGNFDSVYYTAVGSNLDLMENYGYVGYDAGANAARGDSIAYSSPEFFGAQLNGQLKHYNKGATVSGDEELMYQMSGTFTAGAISAGAGAIFANDKAESVTAEDGSVSPAYKESIFGGVVGYTLFEKLTLLLMAEHRTDNKIDELNTAVGVTYDYGFGTIYSTGGRDWEKKFYGSAGVNYQFSDPMYAFVEYSYGKPIGADYAFTTGLSYSF